MYSSLPKACVKAVDACGRLCGISAVYAQVFGRVLEPMEKASVYTTSFTSFLRNVIPSQFDLLREGFSTLYTGPITITTKYITT